MAFQNTKMRLKDAASINASSSLLKADVIVRGSANTGVIRAGEFTVNATAGLLVNTTIYQAEALYVKTTAPTGINSIAGTLATGIAGAKVEVNVSNCNSTSAGLAALANTTYGLVVQFTADSNTRQIRPTAYMAFGEKQGTLLSGTGTANSVAYLFDLGFAEGTSNTFYINATSTTGAANGAFRNANCSGSNAGCLAIRVNGVDKFIPLYGTIA